MALTKVQNGMLLSGIVSKTTTYTAVLADTIILCTSSGGAWTLSLPTAVGNEGKRFIIKKTDTSANAITIDPNGSETIDGYTTVKMFTVNEVFEIVSDNSNWQIVQHKTITPWAAYTPTFTGFGTVSSVNMRWQRRGTNIFIEGDVTGGTAAGTGASLTLPNSWNVSTNIGATVKLIGRMTTNSTTANNYKDFSVIAASGSGNTPGISAIEYAAAFSALQTQNGNSLVANTLQMSFKLDVDVQDWIE